MSLISKPRQFLALLLCLLTTATHATQWVELDGAYVDTDSIQQHGAITKFWVKTYYPKDGILKAGKFRLDHTKEMIEINCRGHLMRQVYFVGYYKSDLVYSGAVDTPFTPIIPESFGDRIYEFICIQGKI